jgi:magnesium transporter
MDILIREDLTARLRDALRLPLGGGGGRAVADALEGAHPADIAEAMENLTRPEALAAFNWLDNARAAEVLDELDSELARFLLDSAPPGRIAELLDRLPMDDAAEVVADVSPEKAETLLADLSARAPEDAAEVRELLSYAASTAGRLMTDRLVRLSPSMTVEEAFAAVRRADPEIETLTDLYVVEGSGGNGSGEGRLIGVLSLRELVRARPGQRIRDIMTPEPITVGVDTDQQEVARIISKYDFLALPVLDRTGNFAGIVTVDDVIDVLVEEFNEDYMRLVGSDAEEMDRRTPAQVAKLRLPWLMGTLVIELCAGLVISRFDGVLKQVILLASFMPVISAISGNVGLQAAAIVVRGLDTGHVSLTQWWRAVGKEMITSLLLALGCGLVLGIVGVVWSGKLPFGIIIGGAMTASMLTAGFMGTVIPMASKRLGFDPAATAGPFETAFQDVIGFAVFLWLASLLLAWLR